MASRGDFTDDEWERLGRAPLVAAMAISIADPGGPLETLRESSAALKTIAEAAKDGGYGEFVQSIAQDVAAKAQRRQSPLGDFRPNRANARQEILEELRAVNALLVEKSTPEELGEFREWLRTTAQRAALAATEGGFLGFGGERVSEREQQMLETVGRIFGAF